MDIELLKTFLEVNKTKHFGKAAENLYLTQAAVSARIKQLESYIGSPLFTRYRNNLQLTAIGNRLIKHAETILISWEHALADTQLKDNQKKVLVLGATSGLWDLILQDALNQIHTDYSEIALRAESYEPDVLTRRLVERTLDLGLLYEPPKITDLVSVPVAQAELILVATEKNHDLTTALSNNYVSVDWGTAVNITHAQFFQDIQSPVLHTTLARIALDFILHHGGSAYLPLNLINEQLNKKLYQIEEAPVITRSIFACYHNDNMNEEIIKNVIQIIKELNNLLKN